MPRRDDVVCSQGKTPNRHSHLRRIPERRVNRTSTFLDEKGRNGSQWDRIVAAVSAATSPGVPGWRVGRVPTAVSRLTAR